MHVIYFISLFLPYCKQYSGSARPEVRATAEPYGGAYPPSYPPPRTPSRHSSLPRYGRRAETDGSLRTILT